MIKTKIYFDLDHFEQAVYDELPKWMRKTIAKSPEHKALVQKGMAQPFNEEDAQAAQPAAQAATPASTNYSVEQAAAPDENADEIDF